MPTVDSTLFVDRSMTCSDPAEPMVYARGGLAAVTVAVTVAGR